MFIKLLAGSHPIFHAFTNYQKIYIIFIIRFTLNESILFEINTAF